MKKKFFAGKKEKNNPQKETELFKQIQKRNYIGIHLIAEFWYSKDINDAEKIEKILLTAAKKANNTPLKTIVHRFSPRGFTGFILLAESHIALHFWPEHNYLAVDIFTCGRKTMPYQALIYLKSQFKPQKVEIKEIKRGRIRQLKS